MGVPSFNRKDIKIYICGVLRTGGVTYRRPAMKHPAENRMSNIDKSDLMKKSDITSAGSAGLAEAFSNLPENKQFTDLDCGQTRA